MNVEELYEIYLKHPVITTDSRKVEPGSIFFALKGEKFNGNEYAQKAVELGAAYAVIDDEHFTNENTILVDDVLQTLQQLAHHHRKNLNIPFLAITGSNGKTTTKELIHAVLSTKFNTSTTVGNLNNHIGVPLTILRIRQDAEIAVIEMGANHQKEIESYCKIALPSHGLITNCGKAHLEGFGGEEGVRKGKGELFDHLREHGGTAFIMKDYDYLCQMSKGIKEVFTYGTHDANVVGQVVKSDPFLEVQFTGGLNEKVATNLVGSYNLSNVLAAAAVGTYFSVAENNVKKAIEQYNPSNSRSQLMKQGSNQIILDAYNANPSSMKVAIDNFAKLNSNAPKGKILVLGAMAELGEESLQEHINIVAEIQKHNWENVLLVGGDFQKIKHSFLSFDTPEKAGEWLQENGTAHKYLLIKGSRSMAMEKVLAYL